MRQHILWRGAIHRARAQPRPNAPVGEQRSAQHSTTLLSGEPETTNVCCDDCGSAAEMGGGALLACRGGRSAPSSFQTANKGSLCREVKLNRGNAMQLASQEA
jgi:hypothetical protein